MKLCYHDIDNFGDRLNPWLWEQLLPDVLDEDESTAFVGIGTLLNDRLPQRIPNARQTVVFGTGVGYSKGNLPAIDDSWTIYCVRGPLSAKALGFSEELAVTDGAMLVRRLYRPTKRKPHKFAYMPHWTQSKSGGKSWQSICDRIGFKYIDARWSVEKVLSEICATEVLLTEAMHGAIMADALRIPWIPIYTSNRILNFKWQDWCSSVGVEYEPQKLTHPFTWQQQLLSIGLKPQPKDPKDRNFLLDPPRKVGPRTALRHWFKEGDIAAQLASIAKKSRPNLSDDVHIERLTVELESRLQKFKEDVSCGRFS